MNVTPLHILTLYRHRNEVLWTNTELFIMRGFQQLIASVGIESILGSSAWFSQALAINTLQVYALGQVKLENHGARINWLLPVNNSQSDPLPILLDNLAVEAGLHGAAFITAAARVDDCLFKFLRHAGYSLYCWQAFWKLSKELQQPSNLHEVTWSKPDSLDAIEITLLQQKLLSSAARSILISAAESLPDFILRINGQLIGYARVTCFNNRVMIVPIFARESFDLKLVLTSLISEFFANADKVFLLQSADIGWLTDDLEKIASILAPREELLVKHLTAMQRIPKAELTPSANGKRANPATPMMPVSKHKDNI